MATPFIDQFADFLEDEGIGTVNDDIFVGRQPDKHSNTGEIIHNCIMVKDTGGIDSDVYIPVTGPSVQVIVRDAEYDQAEQKMKEIHDLCLAKANFNLVSGGIYVQLIRDLGHYEYLGEDPNGNEEFSLNLLFSVKREDLMDNY